MKSQEGKTFIGYPDIISYKCSKAIMEQMEKSICRIKIKNNKSIGFFCKIPFLEENNFLPALITNNNIINKDILNSNTKIEIKIGVENKERIFDLNNRIKYTNKEFDITIIELKENDKINNYLELDDEIIKNILDNNHSNNEFEQKTVYMIQYPTDELGVSYGIMTPKQDDKEYYFHHTCMTKDDSFGSPILNLKNKIIGIHKKESNKYNINLGAFLNCSIKDFIQKNYNKKKKINNYSKNYLQFNDKGKFEKEEQALANYFGEGNYIGFYKKKFLKDRFQITKDDFIAGDIVVMFHAIKKLGIEYSYTDYPENLRPYLHRKIWEDTLGNVKREIYQQGCLEVPIFIKPKDKLKRFTGFVVKSIDDLWQLNEASEHTKIWCSESVNFVSEWRLIVINNKIECYSHYQKEEPQMFDIKVAEKMVNDFIDSPKAYCLDVGVLSTGETALIEVNDAFSVGKYEGCTDDIYSKMLIFRWEELKGSIK